MAQVIMYGKFYGRGEVSTFKESVDAALFDKAFELSKSTDEDAKEDFFDVHLYSTGLGAFAVMSAIVYDSSNDPECGEGWNQSKSFGLIGEEFEVGVAPTLDQAKMEYLNVTE